MDLGISGYQIGMGWLAQAINARWVQTSINVLDEETREWDHFPAIVADARQHGCNVILDARGTMNDFARMVTRGNDPAAWGDVIKVYTDRVIAICEATEVRSVEVWGSADIPIVMGGRGPQFDCSTILDRVHSDLHDHFGETGVEVLSGGYGINADVSFLQWGLAEHAPLGFDTYNMHPLPLPCEELFGSLEIYRNRLEHARVILDTKCNGQPWVATAFGIPTAAGSPPPEFNIGLHWQLPGGVRAIDYADAADWYIAFLELFATLGMKTCCLVAGDVMRGGLYRNWQGACGLLLPNGRPKPFVDTLAQWAQEREPFLMDEEVVG